jgi:hypothetical protein
MLEIIRIHECHNDNFRSHTLVGLGIGFGVGLGVGFGVTTPS